MVNEHVVMSNRKVLCRGCGTAHDLWPEGKPRPSWEIAALAKGFIAEHAGCAGEGDPLRCANCGGETNSLHANVLEAMSGVGWHCAACSTKPAVRS